MSESVIHSVKPAEHKLVYVTDSLGRRLGLRKLTALRELDLIEAAGAAAENRRWILMATLAACIHEIDGVPYPFPHTRAFLRGHVERVGSEGIEAVAVYFGTEPDEAAADSGSVNLDVAKNSQGITS